MKSKQPKIPHPTTSNKQISDTNTDLTDNLKKGIENLSGLSMENVKIFHNSSQPVALQGDTHTQGTDIHIAQGQEKHIPHEAWNVIEQKQKRIKPTVQLNEIALINDDKGLENEADIMGAKANTIAPLFPIIDNHINEVNDIE